MKLPHVLFGLLALVLGLLVLLMLSPAPEAAAGGPHPSIPGMQVGGDGLARLGGQAWLLFALFALTMLLLALLPALGIPERLRSRGFWAACLGICATAVTVAWLMFDGYLTILHGGDAGTLFGFPAPTAWMLFGIWGAGSLLAVLYVAGFRRFIYPPDSERRYEALRNRAGDDQ